MEKLVFILAIASLSVAQQQYIRDPKEAAILSEKRYLSNNGQFGSAYTQEDGVQFTEESDQDGNRRGAYSYIDPNGQRRTVTYTAGKNGFQASGDHLPVAPPAPAASTPVAPQAPVTPQGPAPVAPARQYSVQDNTEEGQYHPIYDDVDYWERQSKSRPAAAPAPVQQQWSAPTTAPQQWNAPTPAPQQWNAPAAQAPRAWSAPAAPAPQQWSAPAAPAPQQWSAPAAPAPQQWSAPAAPAPQQWNAPAPRSWNTPTPAPAASQSWDYNTIASTEAPHRFFPPGKLDLNRSPDGFSYSFSKS